MKDLLERGLVFVRDVTCLFEKADGERRNCPRCRGSGLLKPRRICNWDNRSAGNEACFFCEGVGVMPLFGLSGFMLARATAAVNTEKLREPANPPFQIHLCLGKYPGSKSRFSSYRPNHNLSSLLFKPGNGSEWVTDAVEELALQSAEDCDIKGDEVGKLEIPGLVERTRSLQRVASRTSSSSRSRSSAISGRFEQSSFEKAISSGKDTLLLQHSASFSDLDLKSRFPGGRSSVRMTHKAVSSFREKIFQRSRISVPKEDPALLSLASGAQLIPRTLANSGTRGVKCGRRRRNHLREKMEKETIQNTWRLRRFLHAKSEQHTPPESSDALQNFSGNWKDLSQKCLAELKASSHQSNKPRLTQGPTAPFQYLVGQPFYGKLVRKLQLLPSVDKPLKW